MFKKYVEAMEDISINERFDKRAYLESCGYIIYMTLERKLSQKDLAEMSVVDTIVTAEKINFVMHNVIMKKINSAFATEVVKQEKSAFDDYDRENGYIDETEDNVWGNCSKLLNSLIRMAIKVFNDSFSSVLKADIIELIDQIKYELDALESEKEAR